MTLPAPLGSAIPVPALVAASDAQARLRFLERYRLWVRLREKGGKRREIPRHHTLEGYLHAYLEGTEINQDPKGPLFRTPRGMRMKMRIKGARLTATPGEPSHAAPRHQAYAPAGHQRHAAG